MVKKKATIKINHDYVIRVSAIRLHSLVHGSVLAFLQILLAAGDAFEKLNRCRFAHFEVYP